MEAIPKLLEARMALATNVASRAEKYLDTIKDIVSSINPGEYGSCVDAIAAIRALSASVPKKLDPTSLIESMSAIYQDLAAADDLMKKLIGTLTNDAYSKMALHNMSSTYVMNVHAERGAAMDSHDRFLEMSATDDERIFDAVFKELGVSTKPDASIAFIMRNEGVVNKFTIKLISACIRAVGGDRKRRLELIIEKQKDAVLGVTRKDLSKYAGAQGSVCRYNLRPMTPSMPLADLFDSLGIKYNPKLTPDENFASANCAHGIIVINTSTRSPIEFDLRGLIDLEYISANDLKTPQLSGLTKKIIDRFNTTKMLPRGAGPGPVKVFPHRGKRTATWHVIHTINGDLYRALGKGELTVASDAICGLVTGLSLRAHRYNEIQSEDIVAKCFDPKAQLILSMYKDEKQIVTGSDPVKAEILAGMSEWFGRVIKGAGIRSAAQLRSSAVDPSVITEILLDVLTHSTGVYGKGSSEYLVTYIAKFDATIYRFIRELERKWSEDATTDRVFKERAGPDLDKYLMEVFVGVVKAAMDEMDKSRSWTDYDISVKEYFLEQKQVIV